MTVLNHDLVLKSDELYLVGETFADGSGERATGLYVRDTRHLSHFALTLNGLPLKRLSARTIGPSAAVVTSANELLPMADGPILPQTLAVEQRMELGATLAVTISVRNFSGRSIPLTLGLALSADFRDLFDIRGFQRERHGAYLPPDASAEQVILAYAGLDGRRAVTTIGFDQPATIVLSEPPGADNSNGDTTTVVLPGLDRFTMQHPWAAPIVGTTFSTVLPPNEDWRLNVKIAPDPADDAPVSADATLTDGQPPAPATTTTNNPFFNRFLDQSREDLLMLQTSFPAARRAAHQATHQAARRGGSLPAAGIPWFVAPFGRDSLIVGLQTVHIAPLRAATTLRVLASLQGAEVNARRDEEPGKILHEVRQGEMARLGEIPHTPYYGSVDATPLFIALFAETVAWTGDDQLYRDLLPHVRRAIAWIERYGDADGDGFVEYRSGSPDGIRINHQGWKDSDDSLHHLDGRSVSGSIALVEVQGYVYAAYARLAEVAALRGDGVWATELRGRADAIRQAVESAFWMEAEGFYAQALDDDKRQVRAVSSNPGHLLFCGLPSPERAAMVANRFAAPDLNSGWGIRTLSAQMPTYNPMSYHNGSVWPHDNSLIAGGLSAYGHTSLANEIVTALFHAATTDPLFRLPELYCGFARTTGTADAPVDYPVTCRPQAWAAAAGPLLIRAMLGLRPDLTRGLLLVDPALPNWLNEVTVQGLHFQGRPVSLTVRRAGTDYDFVAHGPIARAS